MSIGSKTLAAAAVLTLACFAAAAQELRAGLPAASDMSAARGARLLEGARAEGEVIAYSTAPPEDNKALTDAFTARTGVPVKLWRSSSEDILQRAIAEARAGRPQADAFINTGMGLEPLYRENLLQPVVSPYTATLLPDAYPAHRQWVGVYLAALVQFYNTNLVKKSELPKTYDDLLDPRWSGKLAVEAADFDWFQAVVENIGRDKGLALFRDIVAKNRVSVRKGHSLLANLVVAGEVPLALTVYQFTAEQLRASGAPVDWFAIPPAMAIQVGVGVAREPRHPNAAVLFYDFLISEAQEVLQKRNFIPTRKDLAGKVAYPIKVQDAARVLDGAKEWEEIYRRTFGFR